MALESHEDRLAYLEAFGVPARCEAGQLTVIYDEPSVEISFDESQYNTSAPQVSGPTSVFEKLRLTTRDTSRLTVETDDGPKPFVVREHRADRTGWSVLVLDSP